MANHISNLKDPAYSTRRNGPNAVRRAVWAENADSGATALPVAEVLEHRQMMSASWFVSTTGSDKNPGTLAQPFKTIQAAANIAKAGDFVEIETGTYRENVVPANSGTAANPITFEAYDGENVTISGANVVNTWTSSGGSVYQAPMPTNLGEGQNEVFVDGQEINEARFPNTTLDQSHPTMEIAQKVSTSGGSSATIYDSNLTQPANYWKGAIISFAAGQQWDVQTGTVVSSAPGQVTISYAPNNKYEVLQAGNPFYLTGTLKAFNGAGEWYRDPTTGMLSIWTPDSDNPANHTVEVKARQDAFDLSGKSNITIRDVNIFAATIKTDGGSSHTVLNGINAKYISQFIVVPNGWLPPTNSGIMLDGSGSVLENSTISNSAGDGVFVGGAGSRVTNNVIHDVDTSGTDCAGVRCYAASVSIDHNTIYDTGRDGINFHASKMQVLNNNISAFGMLTTDGGAIYTVTGNGAGSTIAYNDVHSAHSGGYGETGIYLDNNSSGFTVHDNIATDVDTALKMNFSSYNETIYNNTLKGSEYAVAGAAGDWSGTTFTNNILSGPTTFGSHTALKTNVTAAETGKGAATFVSGASIAKTGTGAGTGSGAGTGTGGGTTTTGTGGTGTTTTGTGGTTSTGTGGTTTTGSGTGSTTGSKGGTGTTSTGTGGTTSTGTGGTGTTTTGSGTGSATGSKGGTGTTSTGTGGTTSTGTGGTGTTTTGTGGTTSTGTGGTGSTSTGSGTGSTTGSKGGTGTTSTGTGGTTSTGTGGTGTTSTGSGTGSTSSGTGGTGTTTTGTGGTTGSSGTGSTSTGSGSGSTTAGNGGTGTTTTGTGGTTSTGSDTTGTTSTGSGSGSTSSGTGDTGSTPTGNGGATSGATGTGTSSTGAGGTTNSDPGTSDGSGTDSNGGNGSNTPVTIPPKQTTPPVVGTAPRQSASTPTLADLRAAVSADRAAVRADKKEARIILHNLVIVQRSNVRAYRAARRQLAAGIKRAHFAGETSLAANTLFSLKLQVQQTRSAVVSGRAAIHAEQHAHYALPARLRLASDFKALKAA